MKIIVAKKNLNQKFKQKFKKNHDLYKIISRYVSLEKYRDISMHRWILPPLIIIAYNQQKRVPVIS